MFVTLESVEHLNPSPAIKPGPATYIILLMQTSSHLATATIFLIHNIIYCGWATNITGIGHHHQLWMSYKYHQHRTSSTIVDELQISPALDIMWMSKRSPLQRKHPLIAAIKPSTVVDNQQKFNLVEAIKSLQVTLAGKGFIDMYILSRLVVCGDLDANLFSKDYLYIYRHLSGYFEKLFWVMRECFSRDRSGRLWSRMLPRSSEFPLSLFFWRGCWLRKFPKSYLTSPRRWMSDLQQFNVDSRNTLWGRLLIDINSSLSNLFQNSGFDW